MMPKEDILNGFLTIANERMAEAIRKISVAKGYAPPQYALLVFGGAGGLHACSMARLLGMTTIIVPKYAGLLSAYGILNAQVERFAEAQILKTVDEIPFEDLQLAFDKIAAEAIAKVAAEGIDLQDISLKKSLIFCRLKGQDAPIELDFNADFPTNFKAIYQKMFGHWVNNRPIEIESIRVIAAERISNFKFQISRDDTQISSDNAQISSTTAPSNFKFQTSNDAPSNFKPQTSNSTPPQYKPDFRHKITAFVGENGLTFPFISETIWRLARQFKALRCYSIAIRRPSLKPIIP
jgi:N-methylhydantoinase A/oxoprolinase/acetone carboxylase beta subunit